ncbi:MAG: hypothetical protein OXC95_08545 [Dehalococcoidia bacterium]|nr:hypothetical protein [Dehalococcoidia bacterium]
MATHFVEVFLQYTTHTHYGELEPVLAGMLVSESESVSSAGARQSCVASLSSRKALKLARYCTSDSKSLRLGAAEVYSSNLTLSAYRSDCEEVLGILFADTESEVRGEASRCFLDIDGSELPSYQNLVVDFVNSPAFEANSDLLFPVLLKAPEEMDDIALEASERALELVGVSTGDTTAAAAWTSTDIAQLIVRVYSRATDCFVRNRCLDIIDKMYLLESYGLEEVVAGFDR